ncbi:M20 metallopeptidase family protein [Jatrophihabitans sp. YIM 134969]
MTGFAARVRAAVAEELPAAVARRRALHADPRLSGQEADTAAVVVEALGLGEGTVAAGTGRVVTTGPEPIVLRAELDALPVTEATGVPWSATGAAMHACGHDVHLAALTAVVRAIARSDPPRPVAALLQPREESAPSGARDVMASGILRELGATAVVAAHVQPQVEAGVVAVTPGFVNASADHFEVTIHGHGGHAGYPHTVRDPVVAIAAVVLALQQLPSRRIDPVHGAVCTIGTLAAGTASNIVPDLARAGGTLRAMDPADRVRLVELLHEVAEATARAWGCTAELEVHEGEPAVVNDVGLASRAANHLAAAGVRTDTEFRSFGADDFSYYSSGPDALPSLMAFVGVDGGAGLHDARFLPPDDAVGLVAEALVAGYLAALTPEEHR